LSRSRPPRSVAELAQRLLHPLDLAVQLPVVTGADVGLEHERDAGAVAAGLRRGAAHDLHHLVPVPLDLGEHRTGPGGQPRIAHHPHRGGDRIVHARAVGPLSEVTGQCRVGGLTGGLDGEGVDHDASLPLCRGRRNAREDARARSVGSAAAVRSRAALPSEENEDHDSDQERHRRLRQHGTLRVDRHLPSAVRTVDERTPVHPMDALEAMQDEIGVLVLCGGSKSDLPEQTPQLAQRFTVVDSFDTHARIPEHFAEVDAVAREAGTTAIISTGWDPGLFSINRVYGESILAAGSTYTFWGRGLSQGHSDALRRIDGVAAAVQYTIPSQEAVDRVRAGERPELSTREKHTRECFVVLEDGADEATVREEIVTMPHYFE